MVWLKNQGTVWFGSGEGGWGRAWFGLVPETVWFGLGEEGFGLFLFVFFDLVWFQKQFGLAQEREGGGDQGAARGGGAGTPGSYTVS